MVRIPVSASILYSSISIHGIYLSNGEEPEPVPTAGTGSVVMSTVTSLLGSLALVRRVRAVDGWELSQETPKTEVMDSTVTFIEYLASE